MVAAIQTEGLTRFYGDVRGIEDVSLEVRRGEVFGFLGPNGAGKTTLVRALLDLIRPTRGRAEVLGFDAQAASLEVRRRVGYLPGELALYRNLTGAQLVRYFGRLRGGVDAAFVAALAKRFQLDLSRRMRELSKGNKQKVGLVTAFMGRPPLVLLDEPTSGLDPFMQATFNDLVKDYTRSGGTVFLSSHVLSEVEAVCQRVGLVREGRLVAVEPLSALKAKSLRRIEVRFRVPPPERVFVGLPGVSDVQVEGNVLRCRVRGPMDALVKAAARGPVEEFLAEPAGLDEIFRDLYGAPVEGSA